MQYSKEQEMKKGFTLTVMMVGVLALGYSQNASWNVTNVATWVEAVGAIRSGGNNKEYTITVTGNISVPSSTENTFGSVTGITITIQGNGTLSPSTNGTILQIGAGQTIVAKDLTLKGRVDNNNSVVCVDKNGIFRMEGGATVFGNTNKTYNGHGGGVYVKDGNFIMQDRASVKDNITSNGRGGGVFADGGTFTMLDNASISANTADNGGGVYIASGNFTMQGNALVSGNTAGGGGGVYSNNGNFTMQGSALVSGNTASQGGGVFSSGTFTMQDSVSVSGNTATGKYDCGGGVHSSGVFTIQGGTIANNTANDRGGGVENLGSFTMQGGTISNNTANEGGGVENLGSFTMQGGTISGNNATFYGGGVTATGSGGPRTGGTFTMRGGTISGNNATFYGGGVFTYGNYFTKTGGIIYGDDADQNLKNTVTSRLGCVAYDSENDNWRNTSASQTMNPDSYGFWLNDGDVILFPSGIWSRFGQTWKRSNFNNTLSLTENTMKSSSSNYLWILQRIAGNAYTFKRSDASNTMTLTIRLDGNSLVISGDSGNGQDNWNGTWRKQ